MATKDYYAVLELSKGASQKEIQAAYRRLARKYHPDVTGGDKEAESRFKAINEAYEVLSDAKKRAAYDKWGDQWMHAEELERMEQERGAFGGFGGPGTRTFHFNVGGDRGAFDEGGFGSLFERFFSGSDLGGNAGGPRRGQDIEHAVEVSLAEAAEGTTRRIRLQTSENGRGAPRQLEVTIPPGVDNGSKIRLRGKGGAGSGGGPAGDVILVVRVAEDPRFERRGATLHTEVPVPLTTAALGGEVEAPTLSGTVMLRIPEGTQNGRVFRLAGKGMPVLHQDRRGDLLAKVRVVLPEELTDEERDLFRRLRELRAGVAGAARGTGETA